MASVSDIEDIFRDLRVEAIGQEREGFFPVTVRSVDFVISKADVDDYLLIRDAVSIGPETALFIPGYYEHVVDILGRPPVPRMQLMRRDEEGIQLQSQDEQMEIELSRISTRFLLTLLDRMDQLSVPQHRLRIFSPSGYRHQQDTETPLQFHDAYGRMLTIKVSVASGSRPRSGRDVLRSVAEAGLFNISFARRVGLILSPSWERSYYRFGHGQRIDDIQFPRRTYNLDLVAHYQLALSSDSLVLAYLSLYKILEYFFVSTAEAVLHERLRQEFSMPGFSPKRDSKLRKIVSLIRKFDQRTNEQRMLVDVIDNFFMPDEIDVWVSEYESENGQYYTVPQTVFGLSHKVDLNPDRVASSLAKRVYHIRNVLVHNKEGDLPRFAPFTGHEEVLLRELPLIMFMAEQLIVKTGEDI